MAIDLQKLTLRRLLDTQSNDLYSKLLNQYFTGINQTLFDKVKSFYKARMRLPSTDEIMALRKDIGLQEYIENQILDDENVNDTIADEFLVSQLHDFYIRDETIFFLDKFVDNLDDFEKVERFILPGVGSFDHGMNNLKQTGLIDFLYNFVVKEKIPIFSRSSASSINSLAPAIVLP